MIRACWVTQILCISCVKATLFLMKKCCWYQRMTWWVHITKKTIKKLFWMTVKRRWSRYFALLRYQSNGFEVSFMNITPCAYWMSRELRIESNKIWNEWINASEQFLELFNCKKPEFFRRYVIMDEVWLQQVPDSLPSGLHAMNKVQSMERRNSQLAKLWTLYLVWNNFHLLYRKRKTRQQPVLYELERLNCLSNCSRIHCIHWIWSPTNKPHENAGWKVI